MKLRVVLEPSDDGGYTAIVPALPGSISEGDARDEALANIQEAIQLYLEPADDEATLWPDAEVV
jgi:predicted RNase H-like HicB family nuclease